MMVANWKMNKTRDEALAFIYAINESLPSCDVVDTVICAPAILLRDLVKRQGDNLRIGAQNMHYEEFGAYTGEISPVMLHTTGVEYVIVGHSERRSLFGETDDMVNRKVKAALNHNLKPILCVGETLEQREFLDRFGAEKMDFYIDEKSNLAADLGIFTSPNAVLISKQGYEIGRLRGAAKWGDDRVVEYINRIKTEKSDMVEND